MKQTTASLLTLLFAMSAATQAWTISRPALVRPQSSIRETRLCAASDGEDIKDEAQDMAYEAVDSVKDATEDAADELSDSASDVADDVANAAEDAKEGIDSDRAFEDKTILGKAKDKAVDVKDFVKDKAVDTKDAVKDKAVAAKDYVKDKAVSVKDAVVGSEE